MADQPEEASSKASLAAEAEQARIAFQAWRRKDPEAAERALDELRTEFHEEYLGRQSYVPVFVCTLLLVVISPVLGEFFVGKLLTLALGSLTLYLALRRGRMHPRVLRHAVTALAVVTALVFVVIIAAQFGATSRFLVASTSLAFTLLALVTLPAILSRLFRHARVSINTVAAAMSAYLLLGVMFASAFRFIATVQTAPFFAQATSHESSNFEYFSFITLTTVGYGDLSPGNDAARAGAVAEAVVGQIFLVTIVARVVSLYGQSQQNPVPAVATTPLAGAPPDESDDDTDPTPAEDA